MNSARNWLLLVAVATLPLLVVGCGGDSTTDELPTIVVSSSSTKTVVVTVDTVVDEALVVDVRSIKPGMSAIWEYAGDSFTISFPSGMGHDMNHTVTNGMSWNYEIHDSETLPGTFEVSGSSE